MKARSNTDSSSLQLIRIYSYIHHLCSLSPSLCPIFELSQRYLSAIYGLINVYGFYVIMNASDFHFFQQYGNKMKIIVVI